MDTGTKHTIFAADDEAPVLAELSAVLEEEYTVRCVRSGRELLQAVPGTPPPALILLDTAMPDMNGFEVLVELKKNPAAVNIPVILLAASDDSGSEEKGLLLGAADYIAKPLSRALVRARVKNHITLADQTRAIEKTKLFDSLTGIPNQRSFDERVIIEWKRSTREKTPVSLLLIDLGAAGDGRFRREAAEILTANARRPSDLAARLDSGRFAVLLPNTGMNGAVKIAEDMESSFEAVFRDIGTENGVSIGAVSQIPPVDMPVENFLARAEKALSQAKASGLICQDQG
jgi:diguanylate cyclase (GGDEF)-like protein